MLDLLRFALRAKGKDTHLNGKFDKWYYYHDASLSVIVVL